MSDYNNVRNTVNALDMMEENASSKREIRFNPKYQFNADLSKAKLTANATLDYHM